MANNQLDNLCINTIRSLAVDGVEKAKSGHPGMPMGMAPAAYVLWTKFMRHNPQNTTWTNRDRYIQSGGHGSMLLYSMLHLTGYDLSLDELKSFRQWGSKTPGHPEFGHTVGVEATTGPLGQGIAMAVGMAVAEAHLAAHFNTETHKIVDNYTYCEFGDGDLMEGISHEAASLAGHLKLGKLICFYDDNGISIEGDTAIAYTEDRLARFASYGWHVQTVWDGTDVNQISYAIMQAQMHTDRPSIIAIKTTIGHGAPNKQGTAGVHGEPLGDKERKLMREGFGFPTDEDFYINQDALAHLRLTIQKGQEQEKEWEQVFADYCTSYPEKAAEWKAWHSNKLIDGWDKDLVEFPENTKGEATRISSHKILNSIAKNLPTLIGGSADLAPSTKTAIEGEGGFQFGSYEGRNLHYGVREFAMGAISNGIALYGAGMIPYCATFMVFADYVRPAIRLSSLMKQRVIYIFTHDSIGLGEDGPTHQPIETIASLRIIPDITVIRPADANETTEAWRWALEKATGPVVFALSRQNLPIIDRNKYASAKELEKGAYIVAETAAKPDVVIIATGSELSIALEAMDKLLEKSITARVVSMPSWEIFDKQTESYRDSVLLKSAKVHVSIEAASTFGWQKYIGNDGIAIGIDHFGASAPASVLYEKFGLTASNVIAKIEEKLAVAPAKKATATTTRKTTTAKAEPAKKAAPARKAAVAKTKTTK